MYPLPIKYDTEDTAPPPEATAAPAHSGSGGAGSIRLIGLIGLIRLIAVIAKVCEGYISGTRGMGWAGLGVRYTEGGA